MQKTVENKSYYKWLTFSVVACAIFMATLSASIVAVSLPIITIATVSDLSTAQWVISAYLLVITSTLPLCGRLGDIYGRRRVYIFGFVGFVAGSLLCGLAQSMEGLIAARLLQALGASPLIANSPAIVTSGFPEKVRGKILGLNGAVVALGTLTGPSVGGLLIEHFSWNIIFFINIPFGLLGLLGAYLLLPLDGKALMESIDYVGAVLFSIAMTSLLLVINLGGQWGWSSARVFISFLFIAVFFGMFLRREKRTPFPMMDLSMFKNRSFLVDTISCSLSYMALFANTILTPFYLHTALGFPPAQIGLVMSASPLVMVVTAPLSGRMSDKIGSRKLTTVGLGIMAAGLYYMGHLDSTSSLPQIIWGQVITAFGNGLFQAPNNSSIMSSVSPGQRGIAGGINALARNFGMVSGTAIAVSVFDHTRLSCLAGVISPDAAQELRAIILGYEDAFFVAVLVALAGVAISMTHRGHTATAKSGG